MDSNIVGPDELEDVEVAMPAFRPLRTAFIQSVGAAIQILNVRTAGVTQELLVPFSVLENAALMSINTMLAASHAQCSIDAPPETIIMTNDGSGKLIYRCEHQPPTTGPHEWDMSGSRTR